MGLVLGILGLLWSLLMLLAFLAYTQISFGAAGGLLVIPVVDLPAAIATIVGAVLSRSRDALGAWIVVVGGLAAVVASLAIVFGILESTTPLLDILEISFMASWWAWGVVLAGGVGLGLMHIKTPA